MFEQMLLKKAGPMIESAIQGLMESGNDIPLEEGEKAPGILLISKEIKKQDVPFAVVVVFDEEGQITRQISSAPIKDLIAQAMGGNKQQKKLS